MTELRDSELSLQGQCYQWAYNNRPEVRKLLFHIPNGGLRSKQEASQLKASGVVAGVCDLFLSMARRGAHGLYIEMKLPGQKLREDQMMFVEQVKKEGFVCYRVDTFEKFIAVIDYYLGHIEEEPKLDKL